MSNKHFHTSLSIEENKNIDSMKRELCSEAGITLVEIPYWWNKKADSLAATIYAHRPDLFDKKPIGRPISSVKQPRTRSDAKGKLFQCIFVRKKGEL
jgi:hypothetical protein